MNDIITHFHFLRPLWLVAMFPALFLVVGVWWKHHSANQWHKLIDKNLLPFLVNNQLASASKWPLIGLFVAWSFAIVALAGPTWKKQPQPVEESLSSLVILWDMSPSMNTEDIRPSRLARARLKLIDLLSNRKEGLTGLIAYAGDAYMVTPLTDDSRTVISLLKALSPDIMPSKGSNIEAAFARANQLFEDSGVAQGDILIFTDGIANDAYGDLVDMQRQTGHQVTIWGIGTREGAPIPLPAGGFARDKRNQIVVASLDEESLSVGATALSGTYVPFSNDELDIQTIQNFALKSGKNATRESSRDFDLWFEYGPYLALLIIPFAALAFRRGWALALVFALGFGQTENTYANTWTDLWQTKDQQAAQALAEGDVDKAAEQFQDPEWKAIADYKNQNFEQAEKHFAEGQTAEDAFNLGNTLAHQGRLEEALSAYDEALKRNPQMQEASDNKNIVEQLKELQEQQQNSQQQDQQNQDDSEQQNGNQDQSQQGEGQSEQNNPQSQEGNDSQEGEQQNQSEQGSNDQQSSEQKQGNQGNSENNAQEQQAETTDSNGDEKQPDEAQQQALENQYGQEQEEQDQQKSEDAEESEELASQPQPVENAQDRKQDELGQQAQNVQAAPLSEEQQALEQWLRKVPDDPAGLMRNKFNHQHKQKQRENVQRFRLPPDQQEEERW